MRIIIICIAILLIAAKNYKIIEEEVHINEDVIIDTLNMTYKDGYTTINYIKWGQYNANVSGGGTIVDSLYQLNMVDTTFFNNSNTFSYSKEISGISNFTQDTLSDISWNLVYKYLDDTIPMIGSDSFFITHLDSIYTKASINLYQNSFLKLDSTTILTQQPVELSGGKNLYFIERLNQDNSNNKESFEENIIQDKFIVYPNPATDRLYIESLIQIEGLYKVQIMDMNGRQTFIKEGNSNWKHIFVDVSKYTSGVYILNIQTYDDFVSFKFIVKE